MLYNILDLYLSMSNMMGLVYNTYCIPYLVMTAFNTSNTQIIKSLTFKEERYWAVDTSSFSE